MKPSWRDYYLGLAEAASRRSSCTRRKVGAVVVDQRNRVAGVGYNDSPAGTPGCESCPRAKSTVPPGSSYDTGPGSCVSLHAEMNAALYCDRERLREARVYVTAEPCAGCVRMLHGAGVREVCWPTGTRRFDGLAAGGLLRDVRRDIPKVPAPAPVLPGQRLQASKNTDALGEVAGQG